MLTLTPCPVLKLSLKTWIQNSTLRSTSCYSLGERQQASHVVFRVSEDMALATTSLHHSNLQKCGEVGWEWKPGPLGLRLSWSSGLGSKSCCPLGGGDSRL